MPLHFTAMRFAEGQAVAYCTHPNARDKKLQPIDGVITRAITTGRVTMIGSDGKRRTVKTEHVLHRGYCWVCHVAAHVRLDGALVCPRCEQKADAPAPVALALLGTDDGFRTWMRRLHLMYVQGLTLRQAREASLAFERDAWDAMLERTGLTNYHQNLDVWRHVSAHRKALQILAEEGDEAGFKALFQPPPPPPSEGRLEAFLRYIFDEEERLTPRPRIELPPLSIGAIDTEPDDITDDTMSTWLRGQFGEGR